MNPIFIIDRKITFACKYQDIRNFELYRVNPESLVTDYGMFIPTSTDGFTILDYLDYGPGGPKSRYTQSSGVLISSTGDIRWLFMRGDWLDEGDISPERTYAKPIVEGRLFANRVVWGKGNRRAFGFNETVQKLAFLAMEMMDQINDVLDFFIKGMPAPKTEWHTYNIDDIVEYLKANRPSKLIPSSWAKNVVEFEPSKETVEELNKISDNLDSMLKTSL